MPEVNHRSIRSSSLETIVKSIGMCVKLRTTVPIGPLTVTLRALTVRVTPSGTFRFIALSSCFILPEPSSAHRGRAGAQHTALGCRAGGGTAPRRGAIAGARGCMEGSRASLTRWAPPVGECSLGVAGARGRESRHNPLINSESGPALRHSGTPPR